MAHIEEIMLHGKLTKVIVPDSSVQEIDDAVVKAFNAVNKAGDISTGNQYIEKANPFYGLKDTATGSEMRLLNSGNVAAIHNLNVAGNTSNRRYINLYNSNSTSPDIVDALKLIDVVAGKATAYNILHTSNKPNGSYTGNGSAASRTITTGGIGSVIAIWTMSTNPSMVILSAGGGIAMEGSAVKHLAAGTARCADGEIIMATTDTTINANGTTYYYQVL